MMKMKYSGTYFYVQGKANDIDYLEITKNQYFETQS